MARNTRSTIFSIRSLIFAKYGKILISGMSEFAPGDNRGAFARYRVPDNVNEVVAGSRTSCLSKLAGKRSPSLDKPANSIAGHVARGEGCGIDNRDTEFRPTLSAFSPFSSARYFADF